MREDPLHINDHPECLKKQQQQQQPPEITTVESTLWGGNIFLKHALNPQELLSCCQVEEEVLCGWREVTLL